MSKIKKKPAKAHPKAPPSGQLPSENLARPTTAETELVRLAGLRWPVETAIEEAKSELGMDHYETRTWLGWHHHIRLTFLGHHFLVRLRLRLKKVPSSNLGTKQSADSERARVTGTQSPARA